MATVAHMPALAALPHIGVAGGEDRLAHDPFESTGVDSPFESHIPRIQRSLLARIGQERFDLWFDRKARLWVDGHTLNIGVSNAFAANWIRTKFMDDARAAAREVLDGDVTVRVEVDPDAAVSPVQPRGDAAEERVAALSRSTVIAAPRPTANAYTLNAKYTLEEFVVGTSNQLAYHAASQVAASPGQQFNPLFIHGHCGLGKTHLLQGICHRFSATHPGKKWIYLTGESFTNEFLEAIKNHKTDVFRRRIRQADLLIIDDVHFLANKKATQEEFLHTFNQIDAGGKQVVLASDCAPRQIAQMTESLISRFVSGMVVRVDSPDLATRLEILRRRVARNNWHVGDAVLMHIANSSAVSVRELEGLLMQVIAGINLMAGEGPANTAAILADLKDRTTVGRAPVRVDRIVSAVAEFFGISPAGVCGASRERVPATARAVAMYLARQQTQMSFPEIGRAMGNKNHSTVIAACQRVEAMVNVGQLICWTINGEARHMAAQEVIHHLQGQLRRPS